ncbi:MAG: endonuclease/exonuclease/phosphatase family protein, partial [Spirochaetota bacterium]
HIYASSQLESSWRLRDFLRREVADDEAVVVVGDFNLPEGSRILDPLREAGLSHALPPTSGSYHFFSGITLWPRIDHVLVNDRLEPLGGGLIRDRAEAGFPSDHFPVFSRLRLRSRE